MQTIKIFLASSIVEFERERKELGDYIRSLNDMYIKKGIYFQLVMCEDMSNALAMERKQEEYNNEIRESRFFYILFGREAGAYTLEEFDVALEKFRQSGTPEIYTYFKEVPVGETVSDSVKKFMEKLDEELGHYYSIFSHLDSIKLNMLLELTRVSALDGEIKFEEGRAVLDGKEMLSLDHIPLYSRNESLQSLLREREELNREFAELSGNFSQNADNMELFSKLSRMGSHKEQINEQIRQMEQDMLELYSTIYERAGSGEILTWRTKEAGKRLEAGDYEGALAILRDEEREKELEQAQALVESGMDRIKGYLAETRMRIRALSAKGITVHTLSEIMECYEKSVELAKQYKVEIHIAYEYALFLYEQKQFTKALELAEWLENWNRANETTEAQRGEIYHLLGRLHNEMKHLKEAEKYFREALSIRRRLAEKEPAVYEKDVAAGCNNLGIICMYAKRLQEAEKYYLESMEIYRKLAERNPSVYEGDLAVSYNNLAILYLYSDEKRLKEAEDYHRDALAIRRRLAQKQPDTYEGDLAVSYHALADLYSRTERFEETEKCYREALEIRRRLARQNPSVYEGEVANTCGRLGVLFKNNGHPQEAEHYYLEALEIYRRLAGQNPMPYELYVAETCYNMGIFYQNAKRLEEAEKSYKEALTIYRRMAEKEPENYQDDVVDTYKSLAKLYSDMHRPVKAIQYHREAKKLCGRLA